MYDHIMMRSIVVLNPESTFFVISENGVRTRNLWLVDRSGMRSNTDGFFLINFLAKKIKIAFANIPSKDHIVSMSSRGRTVLRRAGLAAVGLPPVLLLSAAVLYRENHRPKLPEHYSLRDLKGKTVVATGASEIRVAPRF